MFEFAGGNSQVSRSNTADGGHGMFLDSCGQQSSGVFLASPVASVPMRGPKAVSIQEP